MSFLSDPNPADRLDVQAQWEERQRPTKAPRAREAVPMPVLFPSERSSSLSSKIIFRRPTSLARDPRRLVQQSLQLSGMAARSRLFRLSVWSFRFRLEQPTHTCTLSFLVHFFRFPTGTSTQTQLDP